jgi:hypothetical protein
LFYFVIKFLNLGLNGFRRLIKKVETLPGGRSPSKRLNVTSESRIKRIKGFHGLIKKIETLPGGRSPSKRLNVTSESRINYIKSNNNLHNYKKISYI